MVWINWNQTGQPITGPGLQLPCNRFRETLTWTLTQETSTETDTLRIDANGSASFVRDGRVIAGDTFLDPGGPYNITGILSRQDFSPAPPDPNSRTLLDVRGKGSGTKVKDPFSGKLFIVP